MIPINEIFYTIQSEGIFTGRPAVFIRTQGCPVQCKWCDTKHTWFLNNKFERTQEEILQKTIIDTNKNYANFAPQDILKYMQNIPANLVVITGGEPCIYNLQELTTLLHNNNIICQIETSCTQDILCDDRVLVCASPKIGICNSGVKISQGAWGRADFFKMVITDMESFNLFQDLLLKYGNAKNVPIFLQPESCKKDATELCIELCKKYNYILSMQSHKTLNIR